MSDTTYMSLKEAAAVFSTHTSSIRRYCNNGLISFRRTPGGTIRPLRESVIALAVELGFITTPQN